MDGWMSVDRQSTLCGRQEDGNQSKLLAGQGGWRLTECQAWRHRSWHSSRNCQKKECENYDWNSAKLSNLLRSNTATGVLPHERTRKLSRNSSTVPPTIRQGRLYPCLISEVTTGDLWLSFTPPVKLHRSRLSNYIGTKQSSSVLLHCERGTPRINRLSHLTSRAYSRSRGRRYRTASEEIFFILG